MTALERTQATPSTAQSIVEHLMGDRAPEFVEGDAVESILARVADKPYKPYHERVVEPEASATQLEYRTETGNIAYIDEPKGIAQVNASPNRDAWVEESRKSWEALKAVRGNRMRREDEADAEGPTFHVVSVYRAKIDPATNKLNRLTVRHNVDGNRGKRVLASRGIAYGVPTSSTTLDEMAFKMLISDSAKRMRRLTKADVKQAYTNATTARGKRFLECPDSCQEFDEDGTRMVLELGPPLFGEPEAGREWQETLEKDLRDFGWEPFENVPCMWRFKNATGECIMGAIVDDLLFSESTSYAITDATIEYLRTKYIGVTCEHEPTSFAGYKIERSAGRDVATISMPELIEQKFKQECPELVSVAARAAFKLEHVKGGKLHALADALELAPRNPSGKVSEHTKKTQTLTGNLRYFLRTNAGDLNVVVHRLSCVQSCAPAEAVIVGKAAMIHAYETRFRGITYSKHSVSPEGGALQVHTAIGEPTASAPVTDFPREPGIHAVADASWGDRNIMGCLIMMNHGVIVTETKKMGPVDSSAQAEGVASSKCAEIIEMAREIARGMGILPNEPIVLRSDNAASVRVSNDPKSAGRLRHALRRYATLQARIARGEIQVIHVSDKSNAADFLTKWVSATKIKESVAYASNEAAKKTNARHEEVSSLEVSVVEIVHHTMQLRSGRDKVARISRERPPLPNEGGYLAYFWGQEHRIEELFVEPPAAGAAVAESPVYSDSEMEVEEEDEPGPEPAVPTVVAPPPDTALPPIGAQAVVRATTTLMEAYSAAGPSAQAAGGARIADMVASFVSTIQAAAKGAVVEKFDEPTPAHVVAFEGFISGYEPTLRLYGAFYGHEDSDDPELEPGQGAVGRRRGANPFPMPVPFSHRANKDLLARYGYEFNHYGNNGRKA